MMGGRFDDLILPLMILASEPFAAASFAISNWWINKLIPFKQSGNPALP
jgi:hypothetical protein